MYGNTKSFMSPAASMGVLLVCKFDHDKRKGGLVDNNNFKKYNDDDTDKCIMYRVYPVFLWGCSVFYFSKSFLPRNCYNPNRRKGKHLKGGRIDNDYGTKIKC